MAVQFASNRNLYNANQCELNIERPQASRRVRSETLSRVKEAAHAYCQVTYGRCSGLISVSRFQCTASSVRFFLSHSASLSARSRQSEHMPVESDERVPGKYRKCSRLDSFSAAFIATSFE